MRPYLTILRDSFHEALASRVLWVLLIVITILLIFIAPLGPKGLTGPQFATNEILDAPRLAKSLLADQQAEGPTVGKRILGLWDTGAPKRLETIAGSQTPSAADTAWLAAQLNELITKPDFFDAAAWQEVRLRKEARTLQQQGVDSLGRADRERFHRLALEAAFPQQLALMAQRREKLAYFGLPLDVFGEARRSEFQRAIGAVIFAMLKLGVGVVGLLAGLFVTSTIMPMTFEAGAIDLLFSKPVVRSGVYLTKYLGGCAFVVIMASYLIGGIWLLAGIRFGLWNIYLLATIPIFVFIFAVFYSASCLAGAIWRNPIVSVTMAVALWVVGWLMTATNQLGETYIVLPARIIKTLTAEETPIGVADLGEVRRWDAASRSWIEVFKPERDESVGLGIRRPTPYAGPIYDARRKRLVAVERNIPQMGQFASTATIWVGDAADDFVRKQAMKLPAEAQDTRAILAEPDGKILLVTQRALLRWNGEVREVKEAPQVAGFELPFLNRDNGQSLENVTPEGLSGGSLQAAVNAHSGELAILDDAGLFLCTRGDNGRYRVRKHIDVEIEAPGPLAYAGETVLVVTESGKLLAFNAADGAAKETLALPPESSPNTLFAAPDGKTFALLTRDRLAWLYDADGRRLSRASVSGQGSITAISFSETGELLVADRTDRVTSYRLPDMERTARYQPSRSWLRLAYDLLIYPAYRVVPKPSELDQLTLSYVRDLEQTDGMSDISRDTDLNAPQQASKWLPVRDNALFIAFMLAWGCWHVARRDY